MAVEIRDWKAYECDHCGLCFMVIQDEEHGEKNTCCPECRYIVHKKQSKN